MVVVPHIVLGMERCIQMIKKTDSCATQHMLEKISVFCKLTRCIRLFMKYTQVEIWFPWFLQRNQQEYKNIINRSHSRNHAVNDCLLSQIIRVRLKHCRQLESSVTVIEFRKHTPYWGNHLKFYFRFILATTANSTLANITSAKLCVQGRTIALVGWRETTARGGSWWWR